MYTTLHGHLFTPTTPAVNGPMGLRGRMLPDMPPTPLDGAHLTLALVEAQVGSLVDVLPVALLVTTSGGEILRANAAAIDLFDDPAPLVGQSVVAVLQAAERCRPLRIRLRLLRHQDEILRLYVIHEAAC